MSRLTDDVRGAQCRREPRRVNLIQKQDANLYAKSEWITYGYVFDQLRTINYPSSAPVTYEYGTAADT
ncbi:MAG TPA: hypothetical protein VLT47_08375, partial [Anaeromyxobacteraceae bacterium]|nr:hypothetical protein [Anaeromyxobacteraceae bacterium]